MTLMSSKAAIHYESKDQHSAFQCNPFFFSGNVVSQDLLPNVYENHTERDPNFSPTPVY